MQEYHKNRLQSKLEGADGDIKALNNDVDTLKAGLNAIVEILQDSADEPPTPVHEYDAESVVGERDTLPKAVTMPSGKALPNWITSPVSWIPIQVGLLLSIVSSAGEGINAYLVTSVSTCIASTHVDLSKQLSASFRLGID